MNVLLGAIHQLADVSLLIYYTSNHFTTTLGTSVDVNIASDSRRHKRANF